MANTNVAQHNKHKKFKLNNLKLLSINVNSIVANKRRYNLSHFLTKHNIDIALLSETKLKNNHRIFFNKYSFIRNDRVDGKGGGGARP